MPLSRPDGSDPEGFYRHVAEVYTALVERTSRPAKVMAEEAGVPVATAHRWIFEARRRGMLPPARQGRAGDPDGCAPSCRCVCHEQERR